MSWSHELPQVIGHGLGHRRIVIASGAIFAVKYNLGVIARLDRAIQYSRDAPARIEKPRRTGFPAFAGMTAEGGHTFAFPRHHLPELPNIALASQERAQGMPDAGRTHGPPAIKTQAAVTTGKAETTGIPCAMVLTAHSALSGDRALIASVALRVRHPRGLVPASGDQDHTP